jgi:hypothetical protein
VAGTASEHSGDSAAGNAINALVDAYPLDSRYVVRRDYSILPRTPRFGTKDPDEKIVLAFDFSGDLTEGESLQGPFTLSITTTAGTDAAPSNVFNGNPSFNSARSMILQPVQDGVVDCDYYFRVTVPTSNPYKSLVLSGLLQIRRFLA